MLLFFSDYYVHINVRLSTKLAKTKTSTNISENCVESLFEAVRVSHEYASPPDDICSLTDTVLVNWARMRS